MAERWSVARTLAEVKSFAELHGGTNGIDIYCKPEGAIRGRQTSDDVDRYAEEINGYLATHGYVEVCPSTPA